MKARSVCSSLMVGLSSAAAVRAGYRRMRHWGSTVYEQQHRWTGDEMCATARVVHTRAISVDAPPAAVWPWLMQIGQDRSGFYSHTRLENLVGCDMPKVHELRPEWQQRSAGEKVPMTTPRRFGGKGYMVVAHVDLGHSLVLVAPGDLGRLDRGENANWAWQFCLVPEGDGARLVVRSRYRSRRLLLEPLHFVMERRMLRTIKRLSEQDAGGPSAMARVPVAEVA